MRTAAGAVRGRRRKSMNYLLLIYGEEPTARRRRKRLWTRSWLITGRSRRPSPMQGVKVGGAALQPSQTATTVRLKDGERVVTDGPFAETREVLGGYYLLDVPDLDAAIDWAARCPGRSTDRWRSGRSWTSRASRRGSAEIQPVLSERAADSVEAVFREEWAGCSLTRSAAG